MTLKRVRNLENRVKLITEQVTKALNPFQSCKLIEIKEDLASILLQVRTPRHPSESEGKVYFSCFSENKFLEVLFQQLDIPTVR